MSDFYTTQELAEKFGVSKATILSWNGTVADWPKPLRLNERTLRWPKQGVDQFVKNRRESK